MNSLFKTLMLAFFTSLSFTSVAKDSYKFWFVAPEVTSSHGDNPIFFRITTFDTGTNVTISFPANPNVAPIKVYIPANTQYTTPQGYFDLNDIENRPSNTVLNKGVLIEAHDAPVTAYYELAHSGNPDKFMLKGDNALGTAFFVPSQNHFRNNTRNPIADEKVDIVATEDDTELLIIPTHDVVGHAAGDTIRIVLHRGQTFCVENRDISIEASLKGTYISSSKPVAVTISDDSIHNNDGGAAHDLIGDQLVPISVLGKDYVITNTSTDGQPGNVGTTVAEVYVLAVKNNTTIYLNGSSTPHHTLQRGEQIAIPITPHNMTIKATSEVYVYQLAGMFFDRDGNELGSAIVPPINCSGSEVIPVKRIFNNEFYMQLAVQGKDRHNFMVFDSNGNTHTFLNAVDWKKAAGTDTNGDNEAWYTANIRLTDELSTNLVYNVRNLSGLFHLSILEENRSSVSFGFIAEYGHLNVKGLTQACTGDVVLLGTQKPMRTYAWYSSLTGSTILSTQSTCEARETATYWVTAELPFGGCVATDSIDVSFTDIELELAESVEACPETTLTLGDPNSAYQYEWSNGSTEPSVDLPISPNMNETISVSVDNRLGCIKQFSVNILGHPLIQPLVEANEATGIHSLTNHADFPLYQWWFGSELLPDNTPPYQLTPLQTGWYQLKTTDTYNCQNSVEFYATQVVTSTGASIEKAVKLITDGTKNKLINTDAFIQGSCHLYNNSGALVAQYSINGNNVDITSNLAPGVYVVILQKNSTIKRFKLSIH